MKYMQIAADYGFTNIAVTMHVIDWVDALRDVSWSMYKCVLNCDIVESPR